MSRKLTDTTSTAAPWVGPWLLDICKRNSPQYFRWRYSCGRWTTGRWNTTNTLGAPGNIRYSVINDRFILTRYADGTRSVYDLAPKDFPAELWEFLLFNQTQEVK